MTKMVEGLMRMTLQFGGCCPAFSGSVLTFKGTDPTVGGGDPVKKPGTRVASIQLQCDPAAGKLAGGLTSDDVSQLVKVSAQSVAPKIISMQELPENTVPVVSGPAVSETENKATVKPDTEEKPGDKPPVLLPEPLKPKPLKGMDWVLEHVTNLLSKFTS